MRTYWSILKTFHNDKRICWLYLFLIDQKFVSDFKTKANIFIKFLAEQFTPLKIDSLLPLSQEFLTWARLCSLDFSNDEIFKLIRLLSVHKAFVYDDKFVGTMKICDRSLAKPLISLFQNSINSSHPDLCRKFNIPLVKKNVKQLIPNYYPISVLPIRRKIFEKNISLNNRLLNPNRYGFVPLIPV